MPLAPMPIAGAHTLPRWRRLDALLVPRHPGLGNETTLDRRLMSQPGE